MRRLLGSSAVLVALVAGLSGCGDSSEGPGDTRGSDSPSPSSSSSPSTAGALVEILSGSAAGGGTGPAVRLDVPGGVARLTRPFGVHPLATEVRSVVAATDVPSGQGLYGAVVAVGCDVPPDASVMVEDGEVVITPAKVPDPLPECFAPVTSVAIVLAPVP